MWRYFSHFIKKIDKICSRLIAVLAVDIAAVHGLSEILVQSAILCKVNANRHSFSADVKAHVVHFEHCYSVTVLELLTMIFSVVYDDDCASLCSDIVVECPSSFAKKHAV